MARVDRGGRRKGTEVELRQEKRERAYGVQEDYRMLTRTQLNNHYALVRGLMKATLELTDRERDAAFSLLRFFVYYGKAYPKAATVARDSAVSTRTFWYMVKKLEGMGLIERQKQFINGYQTSDFYRVDRLAMAIAQYLAEHGQELAGRAWEVLKGFKSFWREIWTADILLPGQQLKFGI